MSKIALIDADSMIYLIGWNFRPKEDDDPLLDSVEEKTPRVIEQVDLEVINILQSVGATHYIGALGHPTVKCFREDVAKFRAYKGNRKPDADVFAQWKPVIKGRLFDHWGFIAVEGLEADDVVCLAALELSSGDHRTYEKISGPVSETDIFSEHGALLPAKWIICSIDKDLRQVPGDFYDYKKLDFASISPEQARWLFWYQMIVGDSGDGVLGIPGKGDKAAHKVLDHLMTESDFEQCMEQTVRAMYYEHFGDHYGHTIFEENKAVLGMMHPGHLFYEKSFTPACMNGLQSVEGRF